MKLSNETRDKFFALNAPRRILVNSIAKSGTTWLRTMMAQLPGYSVYPMDGLTAAKDDPNELLGVQPGQIFHGHAPPSDKVFSILRERAFLTVFVYRDLRDLVVSNYYHLAKLNPGRAPEGFKNKTQEELFRSENLLKWCGPVIRYGEVRKWLAQDDIPNTTYEALSRGTHTEICRILDYWGTWYNNELVDFMVSRASFEALSGRNRGEEDASSPQRKGIVGDWKNHFSEEVKTDFKQVLGHYLVEYGYETNDNW